MPMGGFTQEVFSLPYGAYNRYSSIQESPVAPVDFLPLYTLSPV
jgi:hypothetical protein